MTPINKDIEIIKKMLVYCNEIDETVTTLGNSFDSFSGNTIYKNACAMCIMQIGELSGKLSDAFKDDYGDIPWTAIKGMRNVIAHAYFNINETDMWETIQNDVPVLKSYCLRILNIN